MASLDTIDGGPLPIDLECLTHNTVGDADVARDVLQIFRDQAVGWLDTMRTTTDLTVWKETAHTMKGASRGVGAAELGDLAEEAERLGALGGPAHEELLARLDVAIARARTYAAQLCEDGPFVG